MKDKKLTCEYCGEDFEREPWMIWKSLTTRFCSATCYIKYLEERNDKDA